MSVNWSPARVMGPVASVFPLALAETAGVAKVRAPHRTGELARSIGFGMYGSLNGYLKANVAHAAPQEYGTSPHEILPVNKKALAGISFGPVARVDHPGNPGVGYMQEAAGTFVSLYSRHLGGVL